jgi:hypothetical protein
MEPLVDLEGIMKHKRALLAIAVALVSALWLGLSPADPAVAADGVITSATPKVSDRTPVTEQVLTAIPGSWGPDGVAVSYRWYRKSSSGTVRVIEGATGETYVVRPSDVRYRLRVKVTGTLPAAKAISRYSSWTSKVAKAKFATAPTPTITGVAQVSAPLTVAPGTWEPTAKLDYKWYRVSSSGKKTAIKKATKATYTPKATDKGLRLKVRVKAYRAGYVTTIRYSANTSRVLKISAAPAKLPSGTVWAWGDNEVGQLGDGTTTYRNEPVRVSGLTDVTAVRAEKQAAFAVTRDGTAWAWGNNSDRQLDGYGYCPDSPGGECPPSALGELQKKPVRMTGLTNVITIDAGTGMEAVKKDGTLWVWGGTSAMPSVAAYHANVLVGGYARYGALTGVSAISGGTLLRPDGTVWAFDDTADYFYGGTHDRPDVQVRGLSGVIAIGGRYLPSYRYECAPGYEDACGVVGRTGHYRLVPYDPYGNGGSSGSGYALKSDGTVWAWGDNGVGQLGDGTTTDRVTPVQVSGLAGVRSIFASNRSAYAVKKDGSVWRWGNDQIRMDGSYFNLPVQMDGLTGVVSMFANRVGEGTYAIKNDGTVWLVDYRGIPVKIPSLNGITSGDCFTGSCYVVVG